MKGRVKFTDDAKGFGFIRGDDGNDYYFKLRDVINSEIINGGSFVTFSHEISGKGIIAKNINYYTPDISDAGYLRHIKHKDPAVTFARAITKDHFGFENVFKPIKGLGFFENLKLMIFGLFIKIIGMIFTIIFSVYFIVVFLPYFIFGGELISPTKEYFHFMLMDLPVIIWKHSFG